MRRMNKDTLRMYPSIHGGARRMWDWEQVYSLTALNEVALKSEENSFFHAYPGSAQVLILKRDCERLAKVYGNTFVKLFLRDAAEDESEAEKWSINFSIHATKNENTGDVSVIPLVEIDGVEYYKDNWRYTSGSDFNRLITPYLKMKLANARDGNANKEIYK